jgi:hypothetical protein
MDLVLRLVGLLGSLFTLAITILMVFRFRKERRISAISSFMAALLSLILLPAFILLSGARLNLLLGLAILVLGLAVGFLRGMTTRLRYQGEDVVGKNSVLFLLGWGGSLALAQLLNLFFLSPAPPAQGRYCVPAGASVCSSGIGEGTAPPLFVCTLFPEP